MRAGISICVTPEDRGRLDAANVWRSLLEQLQPLSAHRRVDIGEPCYPPAMITSTGGGAAPHCRFSKPFLETDAGSAGSRDDLPPCHSITSLARARSRGGISRPSARAVRALTSNSKRVGCSIGRSPG